VKVFAVYLSLSGFCYDSDSNSTMVASFHILYNSFLTIHHAIRLYVPCPFEGIFKFFVLF
jgi:hypothetical protein